MLKVEPEAWASLWRCIRPALCLALAMNVFAIWQILLGNGNLSRDFGAFFVPLLIVGGFGLAYWLFRMLRDLLVFGFKLTIAYIIVSWMRFWASRKKATLYVKIGRQ